MTLVVEQVMELVMEPVIEIVTGKLSVGIMCDLLMIRRVGAPESPGPVPVATVSTSRSGRQATSCTPLQATEYAAHETSKCQDDITHTIMQSEVR